jgi:hypothetical protein
LASLQSVWASSPKPANRDLHSSHLSLSALAICHQIDTRCSQVYRDSALELFTGFVSNADESTISELIVGALVPGKFYNNAARTRDK